MSKQEYEKYGLSEGYWNGLSAQDQELYKVVRPLRSSIYRVDYPLNRIEGMIADMTKDAGTMGGVFQLDPDFQRGHVWSEEKQIGYMENLFRGLAPKGIRFNCPGWSSHSAYTAKGDINPGDIVCVDGLQRLTAIRKFMAGELPIFNGLYLDDFKGSAIDPARGSNWTYSIEVFDISNRAELLQFYLDINRGGVVHTDEEINRVKGLLAEATRPPEDAAPVKKAPKAR